MMSDLDIVIILNENNNLLNFCSNSDGNIILKAIMRLSHIKIVF